MLLVQLHKGHWSLPKGHAEMGESPKQTAERELEEETALKVNQYLSNVTLEEQYMFKHEGVLINKTVTYFLAEVAGECTIQELEIAAARWMPLPQAIEFATFQETRKILTQALSLLDPISS